MKNGKSILILCLILIFTFSGCVASRSKEPIQRIEMIETSEETPLMNETEEPEKSLEQGAETVAPQEIRRTCSLTVRCDAVLSKTDKLKEEKREFVPENGIIFSSVSVPFEEGESVFDVLKRELEQAGVSLQFTKSVMYNSIYIQGIGNLCEFDCGNSGWTYKVNGESPLYGASQYMVSQNDVIEFIYIC